MRSRLFQTVAFALVLVLAAAVTGCKQQKNLVVSTVGQGQVVLDPAGGTYDANATVTLTPEPATGWIFDRWEGDLSGNTSPAALTMDNDKAVTAVFVVPQYTLSVSVTGLGSVGISPLSTVYNPGDTVTLTPSPQSGWVFSHWEGNLSGADNPGTVTMNASHAVTAVFLQLFTLNLTVNGSGNVALDPPGGVYADGTSVLLTAAPPDGQHFFATWTQDLTGKTNPATLVMDADKSVTAIFGTYYTLDVQVEGEGTVTVSPDLPKYEDGTTVTLTPTPKPGWRFQRWESDDLCCGFGNASLSVDADKTVIAVFSGPDTVMLPGNVPMEMVWCPPGHYTMGSDPTVDLEAAPKEEPQHEVYFNEGFWMGKYPVTQAQWVAVMGTNPSVFTGNLQRPVDTVSWDDICGTNGFLATVNAATGLDLRLPTEAQWEYACRAGTTTIYFFGDTPADAADYAWSQELGLTGTQVVGQKLPNPWGLFDIVGNIWEWCADDHHSSYTGAPIDGSAWIDSPRASWRILRGGTWNRDTSRCRSAYRGTSAATDRTNSTGFRLIR